MTITLEQAVKITGEVRDPDGKPVAGATVAPTMTGTSNSLTGDTRFSVTTDASGRLRDAAACERRARVQPARDTMASTAQWRKWANGVHRPFHTKPGERLTVVLQLTRPARRSRPGHRRRRQSGCRPSGPRRRPRRPRKLLLRSDRRDGRRRYLRVQVSSARRAIYPDRPVHLIWQARHVVQPPTRQGGRRGNEERCGFSGGGKARLKGVILGAGVESPTID